MRRRRRPAQGLRRCRHHCGTRRLHSLGQRGLGLTWWDQYLRHRPGSGWRGRRLNCRRSDHRRLDPRRPCCGRLGSRRLGNCLRNGRSCDVGRRAAKRRCALRNRPRDRHRQRRGRQRAGIDRWPRCLRTRRRDHRSWHKAQPSSGGGRQSHIGLAGPQRGLGERLRRRHGLRRHQPRVAGHRPRIDHRRGRHHRGAMAVKVLGVVHIGTMAEIDPLRIARTGAECGPIMFARPQRDPADRAAKARAECCTGTKPDKGH